MTTAQVISRDRRGHDRPGRPAIGDAFGAETGKRRWLVVKSSLPPAWFAGFDDALAGSGNISSWVMAGIGLAATATVLGLAFGKLARDYETGLQALNEAPSASTNQAAGARRWISALVKAPPLQVGGCAIRFRRALFSTRDGLPRARPRCETPHLSRACADARHACHPSPQDSPRP